MLLLGFFFYVLHKLRRPLRPEQKILAVIEKQEYSKESADTLQCRVRQMDTQTDDTDIIHICKPAYADDTNKELWYGQNKWQFNNISRNETPSFGPVSPNSIFRHCVLQYLAPLAT